ncbi:MAG: hypothetical protein J5979_06745 [Lachnospiraceae bacterium]|nr:hypothetical protein [Lachnospiraceae bacterium]
MQQNNFVCMHEALKHCKRTLEKCSTECKEYGNCGECGNYHIPPGQDPCRGCAFLRIKGPNNHQEGEEQE